MNECTTKNNSLSSTGKSENPPTYSKSKDYPAKLVNSIASSPVSVPLIVQLPHWESGPWSAVSKNKEIDEGLKINNNGKNIWCRHGKCRNRTRQHLRHKEKSIATNHSNP